MKFTIVVDTHHCIVSDEAEQWLTAHSVEPVVFNNMEGMESETWTVEAEFVPQFVLEVSNVKGSIDMGSCAGFYQLPTGEWAGDNVQGWKVSLTRFEQGVQPEDKFKYLPCRWATPQEAEHLNIRRNKVNTLMRWLS